MSEISIVKAKTENVPEIAKLFSATGRSVNEPKLYDLLSKMPAMLAYDGGNLVGFAYGGDFAPDILELRNLYVSASYRSYGVGSQLLHHFEKAALEKGFAAIIASNSAMYINQDGKRDAAAFYDRNHYQLIGVTSHTKIFYKNLIPS